MALLNKVKEYRIVKGINQQELGRLVGASRQTISSIECGDYHPSIVLALKIAKVFEVNVEEIFNYQEDEND
ncbi:MAG: helix-turn-helix transcriptional regulator [Anaerorhabdus sp.]|uniref:helix-turn-helix transcriptional regulator n=2 Tax=Anaerorhabdus sp. TaxID=1872524 RepID=UPI002FC5D556